MLVMNKGIPEKAEREAVGVKPIQPRASGPQTLHTAANHFQLIIFDCGQSVGSYKTLNGFLKKSKDNKSDLKCYIFRHVNKLAPCVSKGLKVGT